MVKAFGFTFSLSGNHKIRDYRHLEHCQCQVFTGMLPEVSTIGGTRLRGALITSQHLIKVTRPCQNRGTSGAELYRSGDPYPVSLALAGVLHRTCARVSVLIQAYPTQSQAQLQGRDRDEHFWCKGRYPMTRYRSPLTNISVDCSTSL